MSGLCWTETLVWYSRVPMRPAHAHCQVDWLAVRISHCESLTLHAVRETAYPLLDSRVSGLIGLMAVARVRAG